MAQEGNTKDVDVMLGRPHKAILAMAIPIAIAMIAQSINNLVDAVWVGLISADGLAAVGLVFPLFFILIGFGNGIGIGASSLISRRIGAGDRRGANRAAAQAFMLSIAVSAALTVCLVGSLPYVMALFGSGEVLRLSLQYSYPLFICTFVAVHVSVMSALLRSEGAAKRSMIIQLIGAGLNVVLNPIFIFACGFGIAGSALATVCAMTAGMLVSFYWYFRKKDTYLNLTLRGFRFSWPEIRLILKVGLPAAVELIVVSISVMLMNIILIAADGEDGVAIYSTSWRLLQMIQIPMMGIGSALVPVAAAAYGMRRMEKVSSAYWYAAELAVGLTIVLAAIEAVFTAQIAWLFTMTPDTARLEPGIVEFMRIAALFLPFSALFFVSSSLFQAFGLGLRSLIVTLVTNLLQIPFCYAQVLMGGGLDAVFWGVCATEIAGALFSFVWAVHTMRKISRLPGMIGS